MKLHTSILLSFLSTSAFISSPVLSMENEDVSEATWTVSHKAKENLTERRKLEAFLDKQDYPAAFKSLRATLPSTCPDAEIVNFLMTSNKYPGWDKGNPEDKEWVVAKITGKPIQTDLNRVAKVTGKSQDLAVTLKELNPDMEDHIAAAWADVMKDQNPALMLGDQYSDEDLTYTLQLPGRSGRGFYYRHLMPPHELSGYYSLGLTPEKVWQQLQDSLKPGAPKAAYYKTIIAGEILAAIQNRKKKLPKKLSNNKEIMEFQRKMNIKQKAVADWVSTLNSFLGRGVPGAEAYQADDLKEDLFVDLPEELPETGMSVSVGLYLFHEAREDLATHTAKLKDLCMKDDIIQDYITSKINPRKDFLKNIIMHIPQINPGKDFFKNLIKRIKSSIVFVLADINNFNLNIFKPTTDTSHELELVQTYSNPGATRVLDLLYVNGHFDRLETILHRHVVPASEFQDPFAQFRGKEASDATTITIGEELKNILRTLADHLTNLRKELDNLQGHDGTNKNAFIAGYRAEGGRVGCVISYAAAEAEYNRRIQLLKDKIAAEEIYCKFRTVSSYIFTHLSKANIKIDPAEVESALENIACPLPKVMYPAGIRIHNQRKVRETILERWYSGYVAFEVKADGLYGTKDEDADPKDFEIILNLQGLK